MFIYFDLYTDFTKPAHDQYIYRHVNGYVCLNCINQTSNSNVFHFILLIVIVFCDLEGCALLAWLLHTLLLRMKVESQL
jgi:hypothetical protein